MRIVTVIVLTVAAHASLAATEVVPTTADSGGLRIRSKKDGNLRNAAHVPTGRQLVTAECQTFATCSGAGGMVEALKSAASSGLPLRVCASATPISCRTTKNSGPSSIAFTSETSPISASMECMSDDLGAGRCILDFSPGDGLDPLAAAYTSILLDKPGNGLNMRGFELRGIRGRSRVAMVKNGAEIRFKECVFTE